LQNRSRQHKAKLDVESSRILEVPRKQARACPLPVHSYALALGAHAVGIGGPHVWGLAAFGQPGVEQVLEILRREFELVMKQCGTTALKKIDSSFVRLSEPQR
jgi:hypothetical protein